MVTRASVGPSKRPECVRPLARLASIDVACWPGRRQCPTRRLAVGPTRVGASPAGTSFTSTRSPSATRLINAHARSDKSTGGHACAPPFTELVATTGHTSNRACVGPGG
eukprot:1267219-Prymnesium_polylepis.3